MEKASIDSARGSSTSGDCIKIMVAGESNVGKTCLLNRFIDDTFSEDFIPPAQDASKSKKIKLNDSAIKIEVFDTLGQERFRVLTATYYNQCNGVLIVFDLTNPASFDRVPTWIKTVEHYTTGIPKILVGTKSDLKDEIKVTKDKIDNICASCKLEYFETSAKTSDGVQEAFHHLASLAMKKPKKILIYVVIVVA